MNIMEIHRPRTWPGFLKVLRDIRKKYQKPSTNIQINGMPEIAPRILFRGQADSHWPLLTTLERTTEERCSIIKYLIHANSHVDEIEAFTGDSWNIKKSKELELELKERCYSSHISLPNYDYLIYLRHHGFPSPLLDWTESPFIASFFAYSERIKSKRVAIYCYIEKPEICKGGIKGSPMISVQGPNIKTHKRHFIQKAWYTIATELDKNNTAQNGLNERPFFCKHEKIFDKDQNHRVFNQDLLIKIELPSSLRDQVLNELNDYNINAFTLMQSEDSLIKTIAMKEFDLKNM